jgi:hypothetical protein
MSRRYSYRQIKSRLDEFYPRPGCSCEYTAGYRAALDEVLLSFSPERFFASAIEAQRAATPKSDAVADESATANGGDAQPYEPDSSQSIPNE